MNPDQQELPLVSVIIPIFNHEDFIVECLNSIKADVYPRIELVAIDDGSEDESYARLLEWIERTDHGFESVYTGQQKNAGIPQTLNRLVEMCNGEFIFSIASDDQVAQDGIRNLVQFYKQFCTQPTLLFSDSELMSFSGKKIAESSCSYYQRHEEKMVQSKKYLSLEVITQWGTPFQFQFFPKSLLENCGGYDESLSYEDLYFALKNVAAGTVAYAPLCSRRYRLKPEGMLTPGFDIDGLSQVPTRKKVLAEFGFGHQMLIRWMNFRDTRKSRPLKAASRIGLDMVRKMIVFLFYQSPENDHG